MEAILKIFYGTISFMPALFGLNAAAEVINYLLKEPSKRINFKINFIL